MRHTKKPLVFMIVLVGDLSPALQEVQYVTLSIEYNTGGYNAWNPPFRAQSAPNTIKQAYMGSNVSRTHPLLLSAIYLGIHPLMSLLLPLMPVLLMSIMSHRRGGDTPNVSTNRVSRSPYSSPGHSPTTG